MKWYRDALRKIKLAKAILFSRSSTCVFVSSEDQIKASINLALIKSGINGDGIENEIVIKKLVDKIYQSIDCAGATPIHSLEEICSGIFKDQSWNLAIAAGVATLWELKVRLLAARLSVSNLIESSQKSKKSKNMHLIGYRDLDTIIRSIDEKTKNRIVLKLSNLNELRGALVHTNLQQLRVLYNNNFKNFKKELEGNVISLSLSKGEDDLLNLSDSMDATKAEEQDIFSWFLEGTNSRLLILIISEFEKSISAMDDIIAFRSRSHHECENDFRKVVFDGHRLTDAETKRFIERDLFVRTTKDPDLFFERIYSYFKNLSN